MVLVAWAASGEEAAIDNASPNRGGGVRLKKPVGLMDSTLNRASGIYDKTTRTISISEYGMATRRNFLGSATALVAGAVVSVPATAKAAVMQPPASMPPAIRASTR